MNTSDSHSEPALLSRVEMLGAVLMSLVFILRNGLPVGVGNQSLQMVWMEHLRDPSLFASDEILGSFEHFPSWFFPILAHLIPSSVEVGSALQVLQVFNTLFLFLGVAVLTRSIFPGMRWVLMPLGFLMLGPVQALAETPLPPLAFTHTAFGLMLSFWTLSWCFRKQFAPAFLCLALIGNVHLLTAAYTAGIMGLYLLLEWKNLSWKRLSVWIFVCGFLSLPVLKLLLTSHADFDAHWLVLLRERSEHHVYPFSWWRKGDPAWGNFALWMGWLIWALAWLPERRPGSAILAMILAPAGMMILGLLGSQGFEVPLILRAQLFRSSLYVMLLTFMLLPPALENIRKDSFFGTLGFGLAVACLLVPVWRVYLPCLLVVGSIYAWWRGALRPWHAAGIGGIFCVLTLSDLSLESTFWKLKPVSFPRLSALQNPFSKPAADSWVDIQKRTRVHTPIDARILTPVRRSGFRLHSRRSIVGEWRDGTMQFFDPAFAEAWALRMDRLSPENLSRARPEDWVAMGEAEAADFVVLPRGQERGLVLRAENEDWVLAETRLSPPPPLPPAPENAKDPESWLAQERFMLEVVEPNIERNRKSRVSLQLEDSGGNALAGLRVEVKQQSLDFGIGSALHHFRPVVEVEKQFRAPNVHPMELVRFKEVFNYSVIGYSGKWMFLEPEEGQRRYEDLDAYVDWCTENGIRIEYHFVTGYAPSWMKKLPGKEQKQYLLAHAEALIDRYGDRIDQWQVINERRMQTEAPDVFALFRKKLPAAALGVSHCARFFSPRKGERAKTDLERGMKSLDQITEAGQKVDFFGVHAHRPFGTWSDPRTMYEVLDDFAAKGLRIHITETGISHAGKIEGEVLTGTWTEELQADYMRRFMKVAFSHPQVDVVNFWGFGPKNWQPHVGLLDNDYKPRPAFLVLKKLVNETWNTQLETRSGSRGDLSLHGFHGTYHVTVFHPDGRVGGGHFHLTAHAPVTMKVKIEWE